MGYLTTIVLHNDAMHEFKKDPKAFGEAVFKAIEDANMNHRRANAGFRGYANYITAHPSRHADDETVYLHHGNTLIQLNAHSEDFKELVKRGDGKLVKGFLQRAQRIITSAKKGVVAWLENG